jgi:hypothetical protein
VDVPQRYARFDSASYADDPPVGVAIVDDSTEEWVAWIPERLWQRILNLGSAYRLHVLGLLEGQERLELSPPQIESLLEELQFLAGTVNDDLIRGHLEALRAAATRVIGEPALVVAGDQNLVSPRSSR